MTIIRVKDLSLRTLIGFKPHEKKHKQDVIIQIELEVDTSAVEHNDCLLYTSPSPRDRG